MRKKPYDGRHIWILGASSGIGRALAIELAAQGAVLALSARRRDALEILNQELGGHHQVFPVDVADAKKLSQAAKSIQKIFPKLDSAVFMAAIYQPGTLEAMDIKKAHQLVAINFNGALNTIHAVLPILNHQKTGQIALCASVAGYRGLPYGQPYAATKAALINLAESLRCEQKSQGIDVKVINSGFVKTPMTGQNTFPMPLQISAEEAAKQIAKGLQSRAFEIHFPKLFTWLAKIVRLMPATLFFQVAALRHRLR